VSKPGGPTDKPRTLSDEETEALNRHGVLFKKRVLHELQRMPGLGIVSEELGVSFGPTRVTDIVALDRAREPGVFFVFECKRAFTAEKRWLFFKDVDNYHRVVREVSGTLGARSVFVKGADAGLVVCSEGYEYHRSDKKADQDPVFKAASQLVAGYLGFIARRERDLHPRVGPPRDNVERYVPVLVTNAELVVVEYDVDKISLETGKLAENPRTTTCDWLVLKHPFPTPEGITWDFRDELAIPQAPRFWGQQYQESVYVVGVRGLARFMDPGRRDGLRLVGSP
jgi:hypothetical protein